MRFVTYIFMFCWIYPYSYPLLDIRIFCITSINSFDKYTLYDENDIIYIHNKNIVILLTSLSFSAILNIFLKIKVDVSLLYNTNSKTIIHAMNEIP